VTLGDWASAAAIVTGVLVAVVPALKSRSESKKYQADGAAALGTSSAAIVASLKDEMAVLRAEVRETRVWRDQLQGRLRRHARWDDQMVAAARAAGMTVPDPPALFDDEEGVVAR
jgi:lambda repressor-like predicted transcriptional regulator